MKKAKKKHECLESSHEIKPVLYNLDGLHYEMMRSSSQKRSDKKLNKDIFDKTEDNYNYVKNAIHEAVEEALGKLEKNRKSSKPYW